MKLTLDQIAEARAKFFELKPRIVGFKSHLFTGSAVISPDNARDVNVVVHVSDARRAGDELCMHAGFSQAGRMQGRRDAPIISLLRGYLNIILTESLNDFIRWDTATSTAMRLGKRLRTKEDRIELFECIRSVGL